ncbi:LPXTG cell wall anchor domain-containing protein [Culicoidibacter larvae]|uniref:LPXTG cell wall anchor domain-containing protein n=1 Tax=Culicoidibacter larvae TaxID=2579976 RepID=A0A5R8QFA5_9FIRM|nr:LPXTG cell wall anchor domain-containing protein [Culicoidibacter larvae]TLG76721.1 LPXTG cell wall anchor domain-containing protein [Culicoidibacter larvae]
MQKIIRIFSAIALSSLLIFMSFAQTVQAAEVTETQELVPLVPDQQLRAAINTIGTAMLPATWPAYEEITEEKFDLINNLGYFYLDLRGKSVENLEGIQYLNVSNGALMLDNSGITDYSPLLAMKQLRALSITTNTMSAEDVGKIGQIQGLGELILSTNQDVDLKDFESQTELYYLEVIGFEDRITVSNLETLAQFPKLWQFDIAYATNTDISGLKDLQEIKNIGLLSVPVSDLSVLESLPKLEYIMLYDSFVSEVSDIIQSKLDAVFAMDPNINTNNWYDGAQQNSVMAISNQSMETNASLQLQVPITIHTGGIFEQLSSTYRWTLLTDETAFAATVTSSNPDVVQANTTNNTDIQLTSGKNGGNATITYSLPSGVSFTFDVTVTSLVPVVSGHDVIYQVGEAKSEADFIQDAAITVDRTATLTTDFNSVVNMQQAGTYQVMVTATDTSGSSEPLPIQVTVVGQATATNDNTNPLPVTGQNIGSFVLIGSFLLIISSGIIIFRRK